MAGRKYEYIMRFFISLYYLVILYVIVFSLLIIPITYLSLYISYYYDILVEYVPIGPLPLGFLPAYFSYLGSNIMLTHGVYNVLIALAILVILGVFKIIVLKYSKDRKIMNYSLLKLQLIIFAIVCIEGLLCTHDTLITSSEIISVIIYSIFSLLSITLPVDVVLLSYTLYRDAVIQDRKMKKYVVIIPSLWLIILWINVIPPSKIAESLIRPNSNMSILIMIISWILITVLELIVHIGYYRSISEQGDDNR